MNLFSSLLQIFIFLYEYLVVVLVAIIIPEYRERRDIATSLARSSSLPSSSAHVLIDSIGQLSVYPLGLYLIALPGMIRVLEASSVGLVENGADPQRTISSFSPSLFLLWQLFILLIFEDFPQGFDHPYEISSSSSSSSTDLREKNVPNIRSFYFEQLGYVFLQHFFCDFDCASYPVSLIFFLLSFPSWS